MSIALVFAIAIALGIAISIIAFPGRNTPQICICMAVIAIMSVGMTDAQRNGGDSPFARYFDPVAERISRLMGLHGWGSAIGPDYSRSVNPCPAEANPGQYGSAARYDGILITGSPEFVSRTITALRRLDGLKSYRYALALKTITEARLDPRALAQVMNAHAEVSPRTSRMSCTIYAGVIVHEGAHVIHGAGHGPVYAAQARALEEMGEPYAARSATLMAAKF